jgi:hypothetical protein
MDRAGGSTGYAYARVNNSSTYPSAAAVTRAHRHLLHIKGGTDLVVAFDQSVTGSAQLREKRFYSYADSYETPTSAVSGCKLTHTRAASRLVTHMLSSSGALACSALPPLDPYPYGSNVKRFTITGMLGSMSGQTTANLWTLSKAWSNTTSDLTDAPVLLSTVGATHEGISLASPAVIVVMPKDGSADVTSTTYTTPHAGEHYVGGMAAGYYDVAVGGVAQPTPPLVGRDGVLSFSTSNSGAVSISYSQSPPPLGILTTSLASGAEGISYSAALVASGGTEPYSWSVVGGALPAGLTLASSGLLSGTPTEFGTFSFFVQVADATFESTGHVLELQIAEGDDPPPASLEITTASLPVGTTNAAYAATLTAAGGTSPYSWSSVTNSCSWLSLSSAGALSGTPTAGGSCGLTARVTDAAAATADRAYSITVQQPPVLPAPTVEARAYGDRVRVRYSLAGLLRSQTCTITSETSTTDSGGPATRIAWITLTPSSTRTIRVQCTTPGTTYTDTSVSTRAALTGTGTLRVNAGGAPYTHAALDYSSDGTTWTSGSEVECQAGCQLTSGSIAKGVWWYRVRRRSGGADRVTGEARQAVVIQ